MRETMVISHGLGLERPLPLQILVQMVFSGETIQTGTKIKIRNSGMRVT